MSIGLQFVRHPKAKKAAAVAILTFALLFVARFVGDFWIGYELNGGADAGQDSSLNSRFPEIPYEKAVAHTPGAAPIAQVDSSQKNSLPETFTEETWLCSNTARFEEDRDAALKKIENHAGLVRIKQMRGEMPDRVVQLVVRVPNEESDKLVGELRSLGKSLSFQVSMEDRSGDVKALLIDKQALEKYTDALPALRSRNTDKLSEYIDLENKLQNSQRKLAELNARIERLTGKESFRNVRFDLGEAVAGHASRSTDALRWALHYYFPALGVIFALGLVVWSGRALFAKQKVERVHVTAQ